MIFYKDFKFPSSLPIVKSNQGTFYNVPFSFDIETTSFYNNGEKAACMYIWMFGFDDTAVYGRTWEQFEDWLNIFSQRLELDNSKKKLKAAVYVHNLGYEFQFMKNRFEISKLFAREKRKPMYFSIGNIVFKDSLILSGMSLDKTLKDCRAEHYKTSGLDYSKFRHSGTPLTEKEMEYCENDVLGLNEFIHKEMKKNNDSIADIPTTKTGYVRRHVRDKCLSNPKYSENLKLQLTTEPYIFNLLRRCFSGGYTHANHLKVGIKQYDVGSYDFTSSYPSVMVRKKYPMSRFSRLDILDLNDLISLSKKYCTLIHATLYNVAAINGIHPLSRHKCHPDFTTLIEDNGKIVSTQILEVYLTGVDFLDIMKCYDFESIQIHDFYFAQAGYLPKEIIECVLDFYYDKCTLKGIPEMIDRFKRSKEMLNSMYGMSVTNPVAPKVEFCDDTKEWFISEDQNDLQKELNKLKANKKTFLNYAWGVFITAYARHELFDGILTTIKNGDFVYADTDSMKITRPSKYQNYIEEYNRRCTAEVEACLNHYNIPLIKANPTGNKPLGVWDYEGKYDEFKALGAKRYAYMKNGEFYYTISGLPKRSPNSDKKTATDWICRDNKSGAYGMDYFTNKMSVPSNYSGKLTHAYIDKSFTCVLEDYLGNKEVVSELSYVHLEPQDFTMSFADIFLNYLKGIHQTDNIIIEDILNGTVGGLQIYE